MRKSVLGVVVAVALTGEQRAFSADNILPTKAPPPEASGGYDWTGFYVGSSYGYAGGSSRWTATQVGTATPSLSGSFELFKSFNPFQGTGSYVETLQGGYNYMVSPHFLVGAEADVSFPSQLSGGAVVSSPAVGQAAYQDEVEMSGTVRGRIGYAQGGWLFYATGGFAYSYDQFARTQIFGAPAGGTAGPGEVDALHKVRVGEAVGGGVQLALTPKWMARFEFLYTGYGSLGADFAAATQRLASDLNVETIRAGLDYKLGNNNVGAGPFGKGMTPLDLDWFAVHGQTTFVEQYAPPFRSPYAGPNSLVPNQGRETWDATLTAGFKLWPGAEMWIDPEIDQGFGLNGTLGIAGFPAGTAFKIGADVPYARFQRYFIRQTINLGGETQKVDADLNQFAGSQTADRLVITIGKYSVSDIFDTNKYSQNPRKDFMNWSLIDAGAFDYAADAWGYSYGAAVEWYQGSWTLRAGLFDLSTAPNSSELDPTFDEFQWIGEIERRYQLWGLDGKIAVTGFLSRGRMGSYADAIALAEVTDGPADIAAVRTYQSRPGVVMNLEQSVTADLGLFVRAGWADGSVEPYEYTDIDRTVAAGISLKGNKWGRPDDTFGFAGIVNEISDEHAAFLNDGGLGILIGDGILPHPGPEQIIETYYQFPVYSMMMTLDYQLILNPAYNEDRGPVSVFGTRLHYQF